MQSADHITPATSVVPTVTVSKDGGTFAAPAGAVTEVGNGWYKLAGNATDRNTLGPFVLHATGAGCDPQDCDYVIVGYDPFDGGKLGLTGVSTPSTPQTIDLTVAVPFSDVSAKTTQSVGDCLSVARADAAGAVALVGTTLTLKAPDGTTIRTFTLAPNGTNPTSRS